MNTYLFTAIPRFRVQNKPGIVPNTGFSSKQGSCSSICAGVGLFQPRDYGKSLFFSHITYTIYTQTHRMKKITTLLGIAVFLLQPVLNAQQKSGTDWKTLMHDPKASLYDIQKAYYADPANPFAKGAVSGQPGKEEDEEEGGGWELFKQYEYFAATRCYPSGNRSLMTQTQANYRQYVQAKISQKVPVSNTSVASNSWTYFNPNGIPSGAGAGRVNCIAFDPANSSNLWLGAPDGGIWKSTTGGTSWSTNTDLFSDLGVSDIAIDPSNSQIMFAATGDKDGWNTGGSHVYTYGVMKSSDGGTTWTNVYTRAVSGMDMMSRILIDPSNTQNIYASGSYGIVKSSDGGTTWNSILSNSDYIWSMEFKPGTSSTLYAAGTGFYVSTNSGTTWTTVTTGLPAASSTFRMSIAVTAANPAYVYVLSADQAGSAINGVYRSTSSGTSFTQQWANTSLNLMGFNKNGGDAGAGQSFYTNTIGVNPTNANEVMVGGVNIWKSTDGGVSWGSGSITYWAANHTATNYVHADIHHILYLNGTTVLVGCDGGIFKSTNNGTAWSDICTNLQIGQIYGIGMSTTNATKVISGWQDNGTNLQTTATNWTGALGGDGMKCFIDRTNDNVMYGEQYNASFNVSTNGGGSWSSNSIPGSETTAWATPWKQDPTTAGIIYGGETNLYKSTNQGSSWTMMGTQPDQTTYINEFAIAPSNSQVIYVVKNAGVYKTTNGGSSWSTLSGLPTTDAPTYVAVHPSNPNVVYVTYSGYTTGSKVFVSSNGGTSWTNYSTGLPNIPANCITFQKGSHGGLYVGMDVGVYYIDSTLTSWQSFNAGLPDVIVTQIEIFYSTGKVRAATYGRGIWESSEYVSTSAAPVATFTASTTAVCAGGSVNFTDNSTNNPTSWAWTFPGGAPASSTSQNPSGILFATAGSYTVSLTATNSIGNSSHTQVITVNPAPSVGSSAITSTFCAGANTTLNATGATTYSWSPSTGLSATTGASVTATPVSNQTYTVTGTNSSGCTNTSTVALTVHPKPIITCNPSTPNYCPGGNASLTASGGTTYSWSPSTGLSASTGSGVTASPSSTQTYTLTGTDANGCTNTSTVTVTVDPVPSVPVITAAGPVLTTSATGVTYQWYLNGTIIAGATSQSYTATVFPGNYTVMVTNTAGCSATSATFIATGIQEHVSATTLSVFPNPNNGIFDLSISTAAEQDYELNVYNALGQVVYAQKLSNVSGTLHKTVDIAINGSGVYLISLTDGKYRSVKKVIIY